MLKNIPRFFSFIFIAIAVWFSLYSSQPKNIEAEDAPETTFSTQRAFKHVEAIAQKPHYVGTEAHSRVRNYIVGELQKMGLQAQTHEDYSLTKNGNLVRPQNILARLEGNGNGEALVIMTHYDSNPHSSPGASDAGSGVGTILEGIRTFLAENKKHKNDIIILFTDAEELGLNGAELFIKDHPWAKDAKLALNFEARGSDGDSFMFLETNSGNAGLINSFKKANPEFPVTNSLVYSVYKMLPNDTDLTVLREQGDIPGYNFAFIDDHFDYHTATDTPENLDKKTLAHQGSYLMPLLDYFKDAELSEVKAEEEVLFFNIPGGEIISYPFSWIFPMLIVALILFFIIIGYGFSQNRLQLKPILKSIIPFVVSLAFSGLLVFLLWKFLLFSYAEYSEMEHGFTYNGYYYITAFISLSLLIAFFSYYRFRHIENKANLFVVPLFFWLLLCTLLAFFLKGAAYFIIPAFFALLQLFVMMRQENPNTLLMAFLSLPAVFILVPFIKMFPVALGLKILFVSALLTVLLFQLLLPVFAYFRSNKKIAVFFFLIFNILLIVAHFKADFTEEHPKPNSLVYLADADNNTTNWYSYDKMPDEWTEKYFGKEPLIAPAEINTLSSKYGSQFTWKTNAPEIDLEEPSIIWKKTDSSETINSYLLKIAPNRNINRIELFADRGTDFETFKVNNKIADSLYLGQNKFHIHTRRWHERLLTYHVSSRDTLRLEFSLKKDKKPEFTLYESSYDLLENEALNVPPRPNTMMPRPFVLNDAVIFKKTISPE
ncbi:M28 family peptidase [Salegentibacter salegens]|uniref:Vacuolar membrane protease n=1 Tax=Salegentibacter salegens TaxID=143223 RepID=A0A1M7LYU7_9FLAO|nr:M28 family peptidase [Salegentibacter salegens]PRX52117.1 peptidase M28-like protein [Salegentibacter salegens]SHM83019.1 Peptidase family M28 [Salegentibacter salegens]